MSPVGGSDCFWTLLKPHQASLQRYVRCMLRDTSRTEDVLQDSVLAAFERFSDFELGTNFRAWIFRFVTHRILNENRKVEPISLSEIPIHLELEEEFATAESVDVFEQLMSDPAEVLPLFDETLGRALTRLAAPERACLLLRAIGEFNYHEIHDLLGMPRGSVMGYLSRARRRMRLFLADYAQEHGWLAEEGRVAVTNSKKIRGGTP